MEILSYPIGLLVGLFPIAVSLGPSKAPAHLLLDGRPVCELTERSPGCMVDLGRDPRVHLLELLRTDAAGQVTERVRRWVNRPGIEPEVFASGGCDEPARRCEFDFTWAHPSRLDPKRIDVSLDGAPVWHGKERHASIPLRAKAQPQVLVADAEFPDGTRATYSRTLVAHYPEEAQAALQAVPILPSPALGADADLADALRGAGWRVRTVEEAELDIAFVMRPMAFDGIEGFLSKVPNLPGTHQKKIGAITASDLRVNVVAPDPWLSTYRVAGFDLGRRIPAAVRTAAPWSRYGDAVAAAGYELGSSPKRRAVVLVLDRFDLPSGSTFDASQARAYLSEVLVPLVVWRIGPAEVGSEWPEGPVIRNVDDLRGAFDSLVRDVEKQRIAWLEDVRDVRHVGREAAPGIALAGRTSPAATHREPEAGEPALGAEALGPWGGEVHALTSAADGSLVYAGTHAGVFRSADGGRSWQAAGSGLPPAPVRNLALVSERPEEAYAATDIGLFRTLDGGKRWRPVDTGAPAPPTCLAVAGGGRAVFVGTRGGGVRRSDDGGANFARTQLDAGDVRALEVDSDGRIWAATETGIFRSRDGGGSWSRAEAPPSAVLGLAASPRGRIYAATAGDGLLESADEGATWKSTKLAGAYLTGVAVGPGPRGPLLASSPDGVFWSIDEGVSWKLARLGPVEALATVGASAWAAGGRRGVLRTEAAGRTWTESNAGLGAASIFSLAAPAGARSALVAGTSRGILRRDAAATGAWKRLPGTSDAVEFYAVTAPTAAADLLVGTAGELGRSFGLEGSWSWLPSPAVFGLTIDAGRPGHAYAATRGAALRTEDGGLTWQASSEGLGRTFSLQLAVDPANASTLFAATAGSGVYRSADGGRSWRAYGAELSRSIVRCLVADGGLPDRVFAGTDLGVFASVPTLRSWIPVSQGLPRSPVYALLQNPETPGTIFAGTGEGLYVTRDAGLTWAPVPAGVSAPVTALALDRPGRKLYAGTLGAGVFAVPLPD
jgi:photosystem II stability/assembly factor-like uncharacterized protein